MNVYALFIRFVEKIMEKMSGLLGFANKELGFSAVLLKGIRCMHIVKALFLEPPTSPSAK